jgi:hypothetical protein
VPLGCIHQSKCCMSCRMRCSPAPDTRICTVATLPTLALTSTSSCCTLNRTLAHYRMQRLVELLCPPPLTSPHFISHRQGQASHSYAAPS